MTPRPQRRWATGPIPARAGIGFRPAHYCDLSDGTPALAFIEVHSENYFGAGGPLLDQLQRLRGSYRLSLHGVGLSLGSVDPLDANHLDHLRGLVDRFEPALVSEHVSWSGAGGRCLNDLLPLPYTEESLRHLAARIDQVQERLARQILVENIAAYVRFRHSTIGEGAFIAELVRLTGCGVLLDLNNLHVNAVNHAIAPESFLAALPFDAVQEIHLAGFEGRGDLLIDTHGAVVDAAVWSLYRTVVRRHGPRPTLIEWDSNLPAFDRLLGEARQADAILEREHVLAG